MNCILDAGHGGIVDGENTTDRHYPNGKQYSMKNKGIILEGVWNRIIRNFIAYFLKQEGFNNFSYLFNDDVPDPTLSERIRKVNQIAKGRRDIYLVSIHCNAGGGRGFEIYTSRGKTRSDSIADIFAMECKSIFPHIPFRGDVSDGDLDKERNFAVLSKTTCPAILTENLFMDGREDFYRLMDISILQRIAKYHANAIMSL